MFPGAVVLVLMVIVTVGNCNVRLTLDTINYKRQSHCTEGVINKVDSIEIIGYASQGTQAVVYLMDAITICALLKEDMNCTQVLCPIDVSPCTKDLKSLSQCYCTSSSDSGFNFTVNLLATYALKGALIQAHWQSTGVEALESNTLPYPDVYEIGQEIITLTLDHQQVNLTSGNCLFNIDPRDMNLSMCCSRAPSPCKVTLATQTVSLKGDPCISEQFEELPLGTYHMSYSVCGVPSDKPLTCLIRDKQGTSSNDQDDTYLNSSIADSISVDKKKTEGQLPVFLKTLLILLAVLSVLNIIVLLLVAKREYDRRRGYP